MNFWMSLFCFKYLQANFTFEYASKVMEKHLYTCKLKFWQNCEKYDHNCYGWLVMSSIWLGLERIYLALYYIFCTSFYLITKMLVFVCFSFLNQVGWMYFKFCTFFLDSATSASWILMSPLSPLYNIYLVLLNHVNIHLGHDIFSLAACIYYTQQVINIGKLLQYLILCHGDIEPFTDPWIIMHSWWSELWWLDLYSVRKMVVVEE